MRSSAGTAQSADGTRIALERAGKGPALVLVEPAGHYRELSAFTGLVPLLTDAFTVYIYDRRGRGESTDTPPYAPEREVEDLEAVIAPAGGSAYVYGFSSGALLAMHAAAHDVQIPRLALLEPPIREGRTEPEQSELTLELATLAAAERHADIVQRFQTSIGVPRELIDSMRSDPTWAKMESVAPTFVYDCMISDTTTAAVLQAVQSPALVLDSMGSSDDLTGWAASAAAQLPRPTHRSLAGEWHTVADETLAPVLIEFFPDSARDPA
jgi:pimeloyl-ACP methyl ester carboxylesterase